MDAFKIENFQRSHPGNQFPQVNRISAPATRLLRLKLVTNCGLSPEASDLELTRRIAKHATSLSDADPADDMFNLAELLRKLNIKPEEDVFINWYRYDDVDRMHLSDLSSYFADIWYPGSDDIEIFDSSCAWILIIPHSGDVRLAILAV